jgi:FkbM family methyltransferase
MKTNAETFLALARKPYALYGRFLVWTTFRTGSLYSPGLHLTHRERALLLKLQPAIVSKPRVVFDIGASVGSFTRLFAKLDFIDHVVAFEPLGQSFSELSKLSAEYSAVQALKIALGNENTEITFYENAFRDSSSALRMESIHKEAFPYTTATSQIKVEARRLDDVVHEFNLPQPDLIKIDVQGFEDRVIAGGTQTLSAARNVILEVSFVELYEGALLFDEIYTIMKSLGFRVKAIMGSTAAPDGRALYADILFER